MLAYVFWHWRRPESDHQAYAERLAAFHGTLARHAPPGFRSSASFRSGGAPWVPGDESYEDWYLVEASAALDPLNDAAVSGARQASHDAAAREAAGGTAGLYRLRLGAGEVQVARWTCWVSKPAGVTYDAFYAQFQTLAARPGVGLWGRQMTLGPTTEFCLASPTPLELPAALQGLVRWLEPIWPRG